VPILLHDLAGQTTSDVEAAHGIPRVSTFRWRSTIPEPTVSGPAAWTDGAGGDGVGTRQVVTMAFAEAEAWLRSVGGVRKTWISADKKMVEVSLLPPGASQPVARGILFDHDHEEAGAFALACTRLRRDVMSDR
jgi:hypothetical protein